jgi:hypothetical protein
LLRRDRAGIPNWCGFKTVFAADEAGQSGRRRRSALPTWAGAEVGLAPSVTQHRRRDPVGTSGSRFDQHSQFDLDTPNREGPRANARAR